MTREDIVAFFDRRQEALSRLDVTALAGLHADDGVLESVKGGPITSRPAIEQFSRNDRGREGQDGARGTRVGAMTRRVSGPSRRSAASGMRVHSCTMYGP